MKRRKAGGQELAVGPGGWPPARGLAQPGAPSDPDPAVRSKSPRGTCPQLGAAGSAACLGWEPQTARPLASAGPKRADDSTIHKPRSVPDPRPAPEWTRGMDPSQYTRARTHRHTHTRARATPRCHPGCLPHRGASHPSAPPKLSGSAAPATPEGLHKLPARGHEKAASALQQTPRPPRSVRLPPAGRGAR